jgi:precorrin-3B synthase
MVGFEFGQLQAQTLGHLARLGPMRLTPWRMILVEGAQVLPDIPGLITRADDPLLRVVACTGAPGCKQAHQPTRALARRLAQLWPAGLLHVSGCAKGCAHPGAAQTTLVATPEGFDLIRNGTAAAAPTRRGLTPQGVTHFLTESRA